MKQIRLLIGLVFIACSNTPPSGPVAGKAYFSQVGCISCHRVGNEGGSVGPDLTLVGFRHSPQWLDLWLKNPQDWKPGTVMPNTRLSPAARSAIVSYLATLKGQDWGVNSRPWDRETSQVTKGRLIYLRSGCVSCHGSGGIGGYPNNNVPGGKIPGLANVSQTFTKSELKAKINHGVSKSAKEDPLGSDPLVSMPAWKDVLTNDDIEAVAEYLMAIKPSEALKTDW